VWVFEAPRGPFRREEEEEEEAEEEEGEKAFHFVRRRHR
jgi:hypothetical protein